MTGHLRRYLELARQRRTVWATKHPALLVAQALGLVRTSTVPGMPDEAPGLPGGARGALYLQITTEGLALLSPAMAKVLDAVEHGAIAQAPIDAEEMRGFLAALVDQDRSSLALWTLLEAPERHAAALERLRLAGFGIIRRPCP